MVENSETPKKPRARKTNTGDASAHRSTSSRSTSRSSAQQRSALSVVGTSKPKSTAKKPRKHSKKKDKRRFFPHIPHWAMWTGGILLALVYIFIFYYFFVSPFSFRWKALYGDASYPDGYEIRGIDISHYQETIDWEKVRNATIENSPVSFVIIKATEGVTIFDENFNDNFYQCRENGLIRGAYHFFIPSVSAKEQARYFMKQVHLETGDLPPVLDVERTDGLPLKDFQKAVKTWLDLVEERYHVKPILYTGYRFKLSNLNDSIFDSYPYWIAHYYVEQLQYKGRWKFWQHTDCGKIDGIKGYVDLNLYNGSMYDLKRLTIGGGEDGEEDKEALEKVDSAYADSTQKDDE